MHSIDSNTAGVSAEIADWSREAPGNFGIPVENCFGLFDAINTGDGREAFIGRLFCRILVLRHRFWSVVTGADIPLNCQIGGGLLIPHPNGIVIHPDAQLGVNCLIFQQVTIGIRDGRGAPLIGGHVDIGAGAKVLGPVRIGSHARIGANAVITKDVHVGDVSIGTKVESSQQP